MVPETLSYFTSSWRFLLLKRLISFARKVIFGAFASQHEKKSFTIGRNQNLSAAHPMTVGLLFHQLQDQQQPNHQHQNQHEPSQFLSVKRLDHWSLFHQELNWKQKPRLHGNRSHPQWSPMLQILLRNGCEISFRNKGLIEF